MTFVRGIAGRASLSVIALLMISSCSAAERAVAVPPDTAGDAGPLQGAGSDADAAALDDRGADVEAPIQVDGGFGAGRIRMAVPAYFYPGPEWDRLIAAAPTVGLIVFNPANGPGQAVDPQYVKAIATARSAGLIVLAYVFTDYGQRPSADILDDIKRTYDFYAPSGVYLAEGPMETDCGSLEAEYHSYTDAVRARDPSAYLAVGTRFCPSYVFFFDLMVEFARNWTEYQTYVPPSWMPANSPERFCAFVDSVPAEAAGQALSRALTNGAGWIFATDESDPNPWGALPSYFDDEVRAVSLLGR